MTGQLKFDSEISEVYYIRDQFNGCQNIWRAKMEQQLNFTQKYPTEILNFSKLIKAFLD